MTKIAFIGLGSIGKRHIRNTAFVLDKRGIDYQIDVFRHEDRKINDSQINNIVSNVFEYEDINNKYYDIIFITNPTSMHYDTIKKCVNHTDHMFIEKPVFSDYQCDISRLSLKKDSLYYVACPLRYDGVIQYLIENLDTARVFSVRAISSSYLPAWRPGTDYRNSYSAHSNLGGGVDIDLIHEWDYLTLLFGFPYQVMYAHGKFSNLEIDSTDLATYIGVYSDKLVELHLDYFGRQTVRNINLYTDDDVIMPDIQNGYVNYMASGKKIDLHETRDNYQCVELEHFFDIIDGKILNDNTIENAVRVLRLAKGIV